MHCWYFQQQLCRSCRWLDKPMTEQVLAKQTDLQQLFAGLPVTQWLPFVTGADQGFRNKAKMVALGAAHQPILGIVAEDGSPVDLTSCPLYSVAMQAVLQALPEFIRKAGIPPYQVAKQKGELKFVLLTESRASQQFMLRFVLRSEQAVARIEKQLPALLAQFPNIAVVSVNIQPVHMAILEGERELFLSKQQELWEEMNGIPLAIRPKSFFQTNPEVAAQLYRTAAQWAEQCQAQHIWDLFCGVGGFGLHCLRDGVQLTGIEIEPQAIASAQHSANVLGRASQVRFQAFDATQLASDGGQSLPDLVIVNPPRRGIGETLCQLLNDSQVPHLIYSSCNPQTLVQDLAKLTAYQVDIVQGFDLFPHTQHYEVLVFLKRKNNN